MEIQKETSDTKRREVNKLIELNPNCSEVTTRIKVDNLTDEQAEELKNAIQYFGMDEETGEKKKEKKGIISSMNRGTIP